ncbi:MAG TPA: hypothetical protein DIT07_05050 [Sphingobacteriaceae bacterium]|nr:hypothetical protein [Sphingobacteriaceae bacterium]
MRVPSLIKSYVNVSDADLEVKSSHIETRLTDNPDFPDIAPALAVFTGFQNTFSLALGKAVSGDKVAIALKNQAKESLVENMRSLALQIESRSNGDKAKLLSSGFDLASDGESTPALEAPANFKVSEGPNSGQVISVVKGGWKNVAYSHEYTLSPPDVNTIWLAKTSTTAEYTFSGLPSGIKAYFRVAVIGSKDQVHYTEVHSRMVQ